MTYAAQVPNLYVWQAIGIALESYRLDVIEHIYKLTNDISLLSYTMEAVIDTGFSLSYRDQVLKFLLPLFPAATSSTGSHVHSLTRLLVTLNQSELTVPLLTSLVPSNKLLAYQFAFDFVEGGSQDFLEAIRNDLPKDEVVSIYLRVAFHGFLSKSIHNRCHKTRRKHTTLCDLS